MVEAREILNELKEQCKLIAVSNSPVLQQYDILNNVRLLNYFFRVFISEEVGYNKPVVRFFEPVLGSVDGVDKSEILIVGDYISSDILRGQNIGIDTCWYNPKRKVKRLEINPTYEIQKLNQVLDIVVKNKK